MHKQFDITDVAVAKEYRLSDGSTEIGIYLLADPDMERKQVLLGVISHPVGGRKWFWYGRDNGRVALASREKALEHAKQAIYNDPDHEERAEDFWRTETKYDWMWENIAPNH